MRSMSVFYLLNQLIFSPCKLPNMNLRKNLFSTALVLSLALPIFASSTFSTAPTKNPVGTDIKKIIQRMDVDFNKYDIEEISIKFMVNEQNELIVVSTGDSQLDTLIKSALNYQEVNAEGLKPYSIYRVKILLDKN